MSHGTSPWTPIVPMCPWCDQPITDTPEDINQGVTIMSCGNCDGDINVEAQLKMRYRLVELEE